MKIAAAYNNGEIFQHFGHTEQFKIYDVENNRIVDEQVLPAAGSGHGALAGFLASAGVNILICGGIGGGARAALENVGIRLYGGVSGSADAAVKALLAGRLEYDPGAHCGGHSSESGGHACEEHSRVCREAFTENKKK